jgi:hypothetical protein
MPNVETVTCVAPTASQTSDIWHFLSIVDANWIAAVSAAATLIFSILIAKEARKINENNNLKSIYDLWQNYSRFLMDTQFCKKWGNVYEQRFVDSELTSEDKEVIWTLIHIWQYTWVLSKTNQVVDDYLRHQAPAWLWMLKEKREFFINFMIINHIDNELLYIFSALTLCESLNDAKILFDKILKANRFPKILRRKIATH